MKKFICGILATAMMFALAANVCAEQVSFTFKPRVRELQIRSSITTMALAQLRKTATPISSICGIASLRLTRVKRIESLHMTLLPKRRWELIGILLIKGNIRVLRTQFSMDTSITQRDVAIPTMLLSMV